MAITTESVRRREIEAGPVNRGDRGEYGTFRAADKLVAGWH